LESGKGGGSDFLVISSGRLPTGFSLTGISVWLTELGGGGRSALVFLSLGNSGRFGFPSALSSLTGSWGFLGRSAKNSKQIMRSLCPKLKFCWWCLIFGLGSGLIGLAIRSDSYTCLIALFSLIWQKTFYSYIDYFREQLFTIAIDVWI
jgi:hypothetical protein